VWVWKTRLGSITYRELKAGRMLHMGNLGEKILDLETKELLLITDNTGVVHITNVPVSATQPIMRELRRLKYILETMGVSLITQWLPSVANKFADALSRRFHTDDLLVRRHLRCSILAGMKELIDAFPYRPFVEQPLFARRQAYTELASHWSTEETRLLCPTLDLMGAVIRKLKWTRAPAILMAPDWPI
jgi:hypothetical protein